ncbi:unnamed protein product [Bubo scandiacus]
MRMLQRPSQIKPNSKKSCAMELEMCEFIMLLPTDRGCENLWTPFINLMVDIILLAQPYASGKSRKEPDPTGDPGDT